jgi:hypothetical protein
MLRVAILTRHDDFHAFVVRQILEDQGVQCSIILTDSIAWDGGLSWSSSDEATPTVVRDMDGHEVAVAELHVVWWRRLTGEPRIPVALPDGAHELVVNDCRAALLGVLLTNFGGAWISHPEATRTAQNKLLQLKTAQRVGLRIPRTLVSQDPDKVRRFCRDHDGQVIVKTVAGAQGTPVMAGLVTPELLTDDSVRLSPAIYQEFIPGTRHLRVCCFGLEVRTALLETETVDWRYPLDAEVHPYRLDDQTQDRVLQVVVDLGLRMGIMDMKLAPDGTPVWLEINPQGQFVFLEGMCSGMPLARTFADFLIREANCVAASGTEMLTLSP